MPVAGETITIVNKSGKVIGTSKRLVSVFNEAKSAYNERKAELKAFREGRLEKKDDKRRIAQRDGRDDESRSGSRRNSRDGDRRRDGRDDERRARDRLETLTLDDDDTRSRHSRRPSSDGGRSRRSSRHARSETHSHRPPIARGVSDSFYTNDARSRQHQRNSSQEQAPPSPLRNEVDRSARAGELARRHTDGLTLDHRDTNTRRPTHKPRSASLDNIDMDLAYGELPPPLPERHYNDEVALRAKMSGLQRLLDECNCLQHSVTAIIDNLSKNPDNLAAVALTLAEISNLVSKMAPGALASMKGAFPAAVALLASPEFAIAAGAAVGVTIVAIGGYKIIKKIQGKKVEEANLLLPAAAGGEGRRASAPDAASSEMESLREIDRIEGWRRGIAPAEAESLVSGTSVEGELVTPHAARTLIQDGRLTEAELKSRAESDVQQNKRRRRRSERKEGESRSRVSGRSSNSKSGRPEIRKKEPSGLRMLFRSSKDRAGSSVG